jgi:hypothetical protein
VWLQVRQDYASVADFIKISVLDSASKLNSGAHQLHSNSQRCNLVCMHQQRLAVTCR